jgi:protein-S-isoprenylcysteine O-methyltransferase Ste14
MKFFLRVLGSLFFSTAMFALLLLLPAWTWKWERAWLLLGLVAVGTVITMWVAFRDNEGLYQERKRGLFQKGQPMADKMVLIPFAISFYGQIVSIGLDVFHWHLLPRPGPFVSEIGLGMFVAGWVLITMVFQVNDFAAPVVKHQQERGHRVIDTGVYAIVRHPMYTAVAVLLPGMALWLESPAAALFSLVPTALLAVRILVEEDFLRRELPGYEDYTRRVRWRLVPGIW